ncbi:hypothetical protein HDU97_009896 [Phlyctochytrium planicorne]|nr:hypothetical protein HDU97_009896 [Phlyctochytrium planicorne]
MSTASSATPQTESSQPSRHPNLRWGMAAAPPSDNILEKRTEDSQSPSEPVAQIDPAFLSKIRWGHAARPAEDRAKDSATDVLQELEKGDGAEPKEFKDFPKELKWNKGGEFVPIAQEEVDEKL